MLDHELRQVLNDEIHGRPGLAVGAPARITHLAFTLGAGEGDDAGDEEEQQAVLQRVEALDQEGC